MAVAIFPTMNRSHDASEGRRAIGPALLVAILVESLLIGGAVWVAANQTAEQSPPLPPAIQLDLTALPPPPKPAPPKPVQPPQPPKPAAKPIPHPVPVRHHVAAPRPKPVQQTPPPVSSAPSPFAEKPTPPPPPTPPAPSAEVTAQISDIFEAQIRAAIQAAQQDPNAGRMIRLTGDTTIEFTYLDGVISDVEIVQSSGHDLLDTSALAAVRDAQLPATPHELAGHTLRMRITIYNHDQD